VIIVGDNLRSLAEQFAIVDDPARVEESCIGLTLDDRIIEVQPPTGEVVRYGMKIPADWVHSSVIGDAGLVLSPGDAVLGCSAEKIVMPLGYLGFIQTKGSLARHFVTIHCSDGQVDPGFSGQVTFEICNLGNYPVMLRSGDRVALLFIHKASTVCAPYDGVYQSADGPTIPLPRSRH